MSREEPDELSPEQQRVRDLLRAHADVGPLPGDVAARLDAALAAALAETHAQTRAQTRAGAPAGTGSSVASLAARRRRVRGVQRLLTGVAAAVVVGGGAVLAVHQASSPSATSAGGSAAGSSAASGAVAAEEVPPQAQVLLSGRDYTDVAAVEDLGEDALEDAGADGQEGADAAGTGQPAPDATPGAGSTEPGDRTLLNAPAPAPADEAPAQGSATTDPAQRPAAERALACTKSLGVDPGSVVAVEIASWRTEPAALVVHRTDEGAEVVVVALGCTPGDPAYSRVQVPLPSAP